MKTRVWLLLGLISFPFSAQAVDKTACAHWLGRSALTQVVSDEEGLYRAFEQFRLSVHRADPENYQRLIEAVDTLEAQLATVQGEVEDALKTHRNFYYDAYGVFARWNPLSEAARYRLVNIQPLEKEVRRMTGARAALAEIRDRAGKTSARLPAEALILEAELLFTIAERHFLTTRTSAALTASLIGQTGDLNEPWEQGRAIFRDFSRQWNGDVAARLTATLLSAGRTDTTAVKEIGALFRHFHRSYTGEISAALAAISFRHGMMPDQTQGVVETFRSFQRMTSLNARESIPLVTHFVRAGRVPTTEQVLAIENARRRVFQHQGVQRFGSALFLAVVLSTHGEPVSEAETEKILAQFDRFYADAHLTGSAAALLAAATYLCGGGDNITQEALATFRHLFNQPAINRDTAAAFTFKILLSRHGQSSPLGHESWSGAQLASLSDTSSIIDPTQGLITGDFINLDGNPFTDF